MVRIKKPLANATVAETCNIALNIAKTIKSRNIEDTNLKKMGAELLSKAEEMQESLASDRSKTFTETILELDNNRDRLFGSFKLLIRGYMMWDNDGQGKHAASIYKLIKKHGIGLQRENYQEQSALQESLLADLEKAEYVVNVDALSLKPIVTDMRAAQTKFSNTYRQSVAVEAEKELVVSATDLKHDVRSLIAKTTDYLNVMVDLNEATYRVICNELSEYINGINHKISNRNKN